VTQFVLAMDYNPEGLLSLVKMSQYNVVIHLSWAGLPPNIISTNHYRRGTDLFISVGSSHQSCYLLTIHGISRTINKSLSISNIFYAH
jgi:hypothetical protein